MPFSARGLEHFCSIEEWKAGKQEQVYAIFSNKPTFAVVKVLHANMVFCQAYESTSRFDVMPKRDLQDVMALDDQGISCSSLPYGRNGHTEIPNSFKLISKKRAVAVLIETIVQWGKKFRKFGLEKVLALKMPALLPR